MLNRSSPLNRGLLFSQKEKKNRARKRKKLAQQSKRGALPKMKLQFLKIATMEMSSILT